MALTVTHPFVSAIPDDPAAAAAGEVLPQAHWNAAHTVTGVLEADQLPDPPPPAYAVPGPEGPQGPPGDDGGSSNVWLYRAKVTGTTGDPGAGFVIWSNATQISATTLRVSATTDSNVDIEAFFGLVMVGDRLLIQQRNTSENYQRWDTTGLPVVVNPHTANAYADIPVVFVSSGGTGTTNFPGNTSIFIAIVATGPAGSPGPGVPAGGTINQVLKKNSATDYDTSWTTPAYLPLAGGTMSGAVNEAPKVTIASSATVAIGAAASNAVTISGTTTITAFDTIADGACREVTFSGVLTLTHNATSLILPTSANITTAAGDVAYFRSLGAGNWKCVIYQKASGAALASSGGGLTNWTDGLSTSAPNATVPVVSLTATNAATNVDAVIAPKGAGAIAGRVATNSTTGGNKRGTNAVDLQTDFPQTATCVASGVRAVIAGGKNNTASGTESAILGGVDNTASGAQSVCVGGTTNVANNTYAFLGGGSSNSATGNASTTSGGSSNSASGQYATVPGGRSNTADGIASICIGQGGHTLGIEAVLVHTSSTLTSQGQSMNLPIGVSTTNATPTTLRSNTSAASASNQLVLSNFCGYIVKGMVIARQNTTEDTKSWEFVAMIKRGASGNAALVGTPTVTVLFADAGAAAWTIAITADTANNTIAVTATGEAAKTIKWAGYETSVRVGG